MVPIHSSVPNYPILSPFCSLTGMLLWVVGVRVSSTILRPMFLAYKMTINFVIITVLWSMSLINLVEIYHQSRFKVYRWHEKSQLLSWLSIFITTSCRSFPFFTNWRPFNYVAYIMRSLTWLSLVHCPGRTKTPRSPYSSTWIRSPRTRGVHYTGSSHPLAMALLLSEE